MRTGKLECPFCGEVDDSGTDNDDGDWKGNKGVKPTRREIVLDGLADLLVTDENGKRIGHVGGKLVNEIPDASFVRLKSGPRASRAEPIYELPKTGKLTVTLDRDDPRQEGKVGRLAVRPRRYTMGVYDVDLGALGEQDTIEFSADWSHIVYSTQKDETPEIELAIETPAADYSFTVHAGGESDGQKIELGLDLKQGTFSVQASAKDGESSYAVEIRRFADGKEQIFRHKGLSIGASDRLLFKYKDWKGDKQAMDVGVDQGNDGTIDKTESISDEE